MRTTLLLAGALISASPAFALVESPKRPDLFSQQIESTKKAMMSDPAKAAVLAQDALETAKSLPETSDKPISIATAQWLIGEAHIFLSEAGAAEPSINAALETANRLAPASKLQGDLLRSRGAIAAMQGHVQEALAYFQHAYQVFVTAHEARSQAIELQDIGQIFEDAGDYERALRYYAQANDAFDKDPNLSLANFNNRAEVLRKLGRKDEAEVQYKLAMQQAHRLDSAVLKVRILCNLADVQGERGDLTAARATIAQAETLAQSGEAIAWRPFVAGTEAKIFAAAKDYEPAGQQFDKMFKGIDLTKTDPQYREFHEAASLTYGKLGKDGLALAHLRAFQRLNDAARDLTASTSAQLASARFDFANQNLRISNLKSGQLRQQVQIERQHARMRAVVTAAVLAVALGLVAFLSFAVVSGRRSRKRLSAVNRDLERALQAKTDFLAMTSHEIRTPLNGILGMTQVMLTEQDLRADLRDRIRLLQGAGETMRALVDDILDVAKMETGAIELVEEDVDVASMLRDVAALWADQAAAKGIELSQQADALPPRIRTDSGRLRQVVFNLMSNAVKFTRQGRVSLKAFVASENANEYLIIEVQDTGVGIDQSQKSAIFEPFHQANSATTREFGGTGLGLAICRKVIAALGGEINVESTVGAGSTFRLSLPIVRSVNAAEPQKVDREVATALERARVLLVDSNPLAQGMLSSYLEPHVAAITCVATVDEALPFIARGDIDHLLLETSAVGSQYGLSAPMKDLVATARAANLRISLLAAANGGVPVEELVPLGVDQVIPKPVGGRLLLVRLIEVYTKVSEIAA